MGDWRKRYSSDYLANWHLDEPVVVEIEKVSFEPVGHEKDESHVMTLKGRKLRMVFNKTNLKTLAEISGTHDEDKWVGVKFEVFKTQCKGFGEIVDCLRIRAPK